MWLIKLPVWRNRGTENFDKFLDKNMLMRYILPLKYLGDQASHISPLLFISLFRQGPGSSLSGDKQKGMFSTQWRIGMHSYIPATFLVDKKAYLCQIIVIGKSPVWV